jgi:peptidyl-prolyl cis-trans isomerase D
MGVIQTLRNKGGKISVVVIAVALLMFLVQDALTGRNSFFGSGGDDNSIGSINGKDIEYRDFENRVALEVDKAQKRDPNTTIDEQAKERMREQVWQQMVQEKVLKPQYDKLGLDVTGEELYTMCTTEEFASEVIRKSFAGQNGVYDPSIAKNFLKRLDDDPTGEVMAQWQPFEEGYTMQRLSEKYNHMVKSGMYTTTLEIKNQFVEANKKYSFQFVSQQYANFTDTTVKVTPEEVKAYFEKNKEKYKREDEIRKLNYAWFDFFPSADDSAQTRMSAATLAEEFSKATDDSIFTIRHQGVYDGKTKTKDQLDKSIADTLFNAKPGTVYGPYVSGNSFKVSKLVKSVTETVDSFKASHILFKFPEGGKATAEDSMKLNAQATDIMNQIKSGKMAFEIAAMLHGSDGTKEKGGDLGWFGPGQMVKEFEDGIRKTANGQMSIVVTQFGYHIIKVTAAPKKTAVKKALVADVSKPILASQKTLDDAYNKVADLASKSTNYNSFAEACKERNIQMRTADLTPTNQFLPGLQNPKSILSWAYRAKKDDVSQLYTIDEKYVIACMKEVLPEGFMKQEEVNDLQALALKDKKAQILIEKFNTNLKSSQNPVDLALSFGSAAQDITGATFASAYLQYIGNEPEIIANVVTLPKQKFSKPIQGQNGVYVVYVTDIVDATEPDPAVLLSQKESKMNEARQRAENSLSEALKTKYKVKDWRYRF